MIAEIVGADNLVGNERARQQVEPPATQARIAATWSAYLDRPIGAHDVALMMVLLKVACPTRGTFNLDDYVDVAAHAGIAAELIDHV